MASAAVLQRHLIVWRDPPALPFVWRGLLPLFVLALAAVFALVPFARNSIQGTVEHEVREQLAAGGYGWASVAVSGQAVRLSGAAPSAGAGVAALRWPRPPPAPPCSAGGPARRSVTGQFTTEEIAATACGGGPPLHRPTPRHPRSRSPGRAANARFAGILAGEQIVFATGSAKIDARSARCWTAGARGARLPGLDPHRGLHRHGRPRKRQPAAERSACARRFARRSSRAASARNALTAKGYRGAPRHRRQHDRGGPGTEPPHRIPYDSCQMSAQARGFHGLSTGEDPAPPGLAAACGGLFAYWWFRRHYEDVTLEYARSREEWADVAPRLRGAPGGATAGGPAAAGRTVRYPARSGDAASTCRRRRTWPRCTLAWRISPSASARSASRQLPTSRRPSSASWRSSTRSSRCRPAWTSWKVRCAGCARRRRRTRTCPRCCAHSAALQARLENPAAAPTPAIREGTRNLLTHPIARQARRPDPDQGRREGARAQAAQGRRVLLLADRAVVAGRCASRR